MPTRNSVALAPEALQDFDSANPLGFSFYDDEGEQQIYILNEQSPGRTHHLVLYNNSEKDLTFQAPGNRFPSAENYHFELRFRLGTLDPEYLSWLSVGTGGWRLATSLEEVGPLPDDEKKDKTQHTTISLYLLFVGEETLVLRKKGTQVIILNHVKAGVPGGSRGSRLALRYHTDGAAILPMPNEAQLHVRQERLQIINHRGKKELPMLAAFEGSSTVLNDGKEANHLILQISNYLQNSAIPLNARDSESPTKFILSFDTSEEQAAWALCDPDNAAAIDVEMHFEEKEGVDWHIRPELQGNNPQWIITTHDEVPVEVGQFFHLHLDGLKTSMPSGFTTLYLLYQNIPGFWDGRFEILIEKSPLKFVDEKKNPDDRQDGTFVQKTKVGIGKVKPMDTLDVHGGVLAETLTLRNWKPEDADDPQRPEPVAFPLEVQGGIKVGTLQMSQEGESENLKIAGRLKDSTGFVVPPGGIIMWSGTEVPEGWKLCDGSDGTPDLRGRFIVGYPNHPDEDNLKDNYNNPGNLSESPKEEKPMAGNTGGEKTVKLTEEQLPQHKHKVWTDVDGKHEHLIPIMAGGKKEGTMYSAVLNLQYLSTISLTNYLQHTLQAAKQGNTNVDAPDFSLEAGITEDYVKTDKDSSHEHTIHMDTTGGNQPHENRPPYYVLAFIMKK